MEVDFSKLMGHELIVEQVWSDGTRMFYRGLVDAVQGTLVHLADVDYNLDPSPAYAKTIASMHVDDYDPRREFDDFGDLWVNLACQSTAAFADVTTTRPDLVMRRKIMRPVY